MTMWLKAVDLQQGAPLLTLRGVKLFKEDLRIIRTKTRQDWVTDAVMDLAFKWIEETKCPFKRAIFLTFSEVLSMLDSGKDVTVKVRAEVLEY